MARLVLQTYRFKPKKKRPGGIQIKKMVSIILALNTEDKEDEITKLGIEFWFIYWFFTWL
jgi:hypothetical protein